MMSIARSRKFVALLIVGIVGANLLTGCVVGSTPAPGARSTALTVENAFTRPAPAGGAGGAFLTVVNASNTSDRLVAARSTVSSIVELHETSDDNGVMKMRHVPGGFDVPAQGKLELKPGGKHVMFMNLVSPLSAGEEIELTLTFEKAGDITTKAPVRQ